MTPNDVRAVLETIRLSARDDEHAHGLEDSLWEAVLGSIANGSCEDPAETARLALQSSDIEFGRWRA